MNFTSVVWVKFGVRVRVRVNPGYLEQLEDVRGDGHQRVTACLTCGRVRVRVRCVCMCVCVCPVEMVCACWSFV